MLMLRFIALVIAFLTFGSALRADTLAEFLEQRGTPIDKAAAEKIVKDLSDGALLSRRVKEFFDFTHDYLPKEESDLRKSQLLKLAPGLYIQNPQGAQNGNLIHIYVTKTKTDKDRFELTMVFTPVENSDSEVTEKDLFRLKGNVTSMGDYLVAHRFVCDSDYRCFNASTEPAYTELLAPYSDYALFWLPAYRYDEYQSRQGQFQIKEFDSPELRARVQAAKELVIKLKKQ